MFNWKTKSYLDPYFRAVYIMQLIAVIATLAGMFLVWWKGDKAFNAFNLLNESADELKARSPRILGQPLVVLWMLWPSVIASGLRSFTGVLVTPVAYRRLALVLWFVAMLVLGHFYASFGDEDLSGYAPLKDGKIQAGFWLTGSSTAILGLLILAEGLIRERENVFVSQRPSAPVDDAERLWRGDYLTCPYCGMLNEPKARSCYNCRNLLFNFEDMDGEPQE